MSSCSLVSSRGEVGCHHVHWFHHEERLDVIMFIGFISERDDYLKLCYRMINNTCVTRNNKFRIPLNWEMVSNLEAPLNNYG